MGKDLEGMVLVGCRNGCGHRLVGGELMVLGGDFICWCMCALVRKMMGLR